MDSDNTLTHPMLYRQQMNSPPQTNTKQPTMPTHHQQGWSPKPVKDETSSKEEPCWDCYPSMMRKIENEGTPEQVEQLHELEHRSP
ncbi:hypothetical protein BX666DRAFT_1538226 [Dichotomocladium elegans]|nr:hypothetical protein BX666DRAFT_1538226 [Dichotomocladium elegans]